MNKKEKLAFAVVAALAMSGGGFAIAQSVNNVSSDQVIYACVTGINGNIVKVSNTRKTCPRGTTPIQWNAVGPKGEQGLPGSAVAKGDKGDTGARGPQGDQGIQGSNGKDGVDSARFGQFLLDPDGVKHYMVQYAGVLMVEIAGNYWVYSGAVSWAVDLPVPGWGIELYQEESCKGSWSLATTGHYSLPDNVAFVSPVEMYLRSEFDRSPMNGYSLVPVTSQNTETFKSFRAVDWSQGFAQEVCIDSGPSGISEQLAAIGRTLESGYFYKATLIGLSPDLSASRGYTVHIG